MQQRAQSLNQPDSSRSGVSLVSMAVILVVLGLVIGSIVSVINKRAKRTLTQESKLMLRQARREAVGFAIDRCQLLTDDPTQSHYYLNFIGHQLGKNREEVQYDVADNLEPLSGSNLYDFNGTSTGLDLSIGADTIHDLAFLIWAYGPDHQNDMSSSSAGGVTTYVQPPYSIDDDDVVDYVTWDELKTLLDHCASGGGTPEPEPEPIPTLPSEFEEPFEDPSLPDWKDPDNHFDVYEGIAGGGVNQELLITAGGAESVLLELDRTDQVKEAWELCKYNLSYDIQIKLGLDWHIRSAVQGLSFRLRKNEDSGRNEMYGISFYQEGTAGSDAIPLGIRPPDIGPQDRAVVLWKQWWDNDDHELKQTWLAYKIIIDAAQAPTNPAPSQSYPGTNGYLPDGSNYWRTDYLMRGWQWYYDTWTFTDQAVLLVRVREHEVSNVKLNDIQVFYGDCSIIFGPAHGLDTSGYSLSQQPIHRNFPRAGDSNATNWQCPTSMASYHTGCSIRLPYYPNHMYVGDANLTGETKTFPTWPPGGLVDLADPISEFTTAYRDSWNPSVDYYTMITGWTRNDSLDEAPEVLYNNSTIRDATFPSPTKDETFPDDRSEIGIHGFSAELQGDKRLYMEEFALKFQLWEWE